MIFRGLLAALIIFHAGPALALRCLSISVAERIDSIFRIEPDQSSDSSLTFPEYAPLGIGVLSELREPICNSEDWKGASACTVILEFNGTLYSRSGILEVSHVPIEAIVYEKDLSDPTKQPPYNWAPPFDHSLLLAFDAGHRAKMQISAIDDCSNNFLAHDSPDLRKALQACYDHRGCPPDALEFLETQ